jgi:hypothetical protein
MGRAKLGERSPRRGDPYLHITIPGAIDRLAPKLARAKGLFETLERLGG